jgi:hypothetical protein
MYLNTFDVFQGDKARELFAVVTFPSPTTKQSTMVRTLLINILCTVCWGTSTSQERNNLLTNDSFERVSISINCLQWIKMVDLPLLQNDRHCNPMVRTEISGKHWIPCSILFEGIEHIGHRERNNVIRATQHCREKAFRIKVANCRALVVNFYSHIPISNKKQSIRRQNTW